MIDDFEFIWDTEESLSPAFSLYWMWEFVPYGIKADMDAIATYCMMSV